MLTIKIQKICTDFARAVVVRSTELVGRRVVILRMVIGTRTLDSTVIICWRQIIRITEERIRTKNIETCLHFKMVRAAQLYVAYYVFILVCQMSTTFCLLQHLIIYHVMLILPSHFCRKLTCCICHSCSRKIESRCSLLFIYDVPFIPLKIKTHYSRFSKCYT
jgi:hypothetical protein